MAQKNEPFDASNPDHVAARGSAKGAREAIRLAGLRKMMQDSDCREWLRDHLAWSGVGRTCFRGNSETFFLEGQQNGGLKIMADITKYFKKEYILMLEEGDAQQQAQSKVNVKTEE